ncbi:uncharacterized protein LOC133026304 isoform X4 [Limanda limanda]|nr:uncharacterized protein LOC133026304 isoform X4 [Limanda limanda]
MSNRFDRQREKAANVAIQSSRGRCSLRSALPSRLRKLSLTRKSGSVFTSSGLFVCSGTRTPARNGTMCAVQLMRVSVHERISAAAEDFLLQVDRGPEAARVLVLRPLLLERLTAAAEAIVGLFQETVAGYEDVVQRSEREICRQRRLLDAVLKPEVRLHRADVQQLKVNEEAVPPEYQDWIPSVDQEDSEPPHIKEEQNELWISQEGEQLQELEQTDIIKFTFTPDTVKTEGDEEEPQSSQLYPSQTEEDRKDCGGPEPARNSGPDVHLQPCPEDTAINTDVDGIESREPKPFSMSGVQWVFK